MKISEFDPVIYPYKLWVCVAKDMINVIKDNFTDYYGDDIEFIDKPMGAISYSVRSKKDGKYGVVIMFQNKKYMTTGTIAHEACHAAKFLFSHISADITEHEPFEYVLGWMADCCDKVKRGKA